MGREPLAEIAVGIDLGTSNSCVAVCQRGAVQVLPNAYGESITASVVAFRADGSITIGNAAKANIIHDPGNTVYSAKRLIGRYFFSEEVRKARAICSYEIVEGENHGVRISIRDETFSLPEISAMVLREMKTIAEARLGQPISKAVVTVPAYFNDNQRQATKDAGRIAGLEVLRILNEPTAAALSYGFGKGLSQRVAIYDLGGGTFDISVLQIGDDVFEVLATCGDTFLGGDDFDDRLIDLLAEEFLAKEGINLRNDRFALEKLKLAAEGAKKGLSVDPEVEIRIPDVIAGPRGPLSIERRLTAAEFTSLVQDLIQRTFKVCDEALQQADLVARDLDGVVLVGGPTRLPMLREAVRAYFQQEPRTDVDPDQVVAMGAAIHAAALINPQQEAYLLDVTPLSLRIGVAGGLAETVIERNTPVPIEQTRTFTTFKDYQSSVSIRVYQGESREAEENERLGQFEFSGFEPGRRGEVEIDVTFEINADGIVNVTARDRKTGQQASARITLSSGLSEGEIQEIIQEGRGERVETEAPPATPRPTPRDGVGEALAAVPRRGTPPRPAAPQPLPEPGAERATGKRSAGLDVSTSPILEVDPPDLEPPPAPPRRPAPAPAPGAATRVAFDEAPTDEMAIYDADLDLDVGDDALATGDLADLELDADADADAVEIEVTPHSPGRPPRATPVEVQVEPVTVVRSARGGAQRQARKAGRGAARPEDVVELTDSLHIDVKASGAEGGELAEAAPQPAEAEPGGDPDDLFAVAGGDLSDPDDPAEGGTRA